MRVSIVIPAFNEERLIGETLRHIGLASEAFTRPGWETETIVCDNNSTDRTAELARASGAQVVFEPVNQIARARNTGAAAATGDWLVFVDADSQPSARLFAEVVEQIQGGRCLAGGVTVRLDQGGAVEWPEPVATPAGGLVHLRGNGRLPENLRIRPKPVRRRGTGIEPPPAQARPRTAPRDRHPSPASTADLRPQTAPLQRRRIPALPRPGGVQSQTHPGQPRRLRPVV